MLSESKQCLICWTFVRYQRNQGQAFTKKIGLYSTQTKEINIDFISDQLESIYQTLLTILQFERINLLSVGTQILKIAKHALN